MQFGVVLGPLVRLWAVSALCGPILRNTTIVVEIISCVIARNGRKLRRSSVPPREKSSQAPFAHMDGSPGWNPRQTIEDREGGDREMPQQNIRLYKGLQNRDKNGGDLLH